MDQPGGFGGRGGNRRLLGDQESVGGDTQDGMMVEPGPAATLVVTKPEFLLEFPIAALDQPAQFGEIDQALDRGLGGEVGEPVLGWLVLGVWPLESAST